MSTRYPEIEDLFGQFKQCLEDMMTPEQKKYHDKLTAIYKDLIKNQKVIMHLM